MSTLRLGGELGNLPELGVPAPGGAIDGPAAIHVVEARVPLQGAAEALALEPKKECREAGPGSGQDQRRPAVHRQVYKTLGLGRAGPSRPRRQGSTRGPPPPTAGGLPGKAPVPRAGSDLPCIFCLNNQN